MLRSLFLPLAASSCIALFAGAALAVPVTFTKLAGVTGGSPADTAVFKADLSGVGIASVASIAIRDNSAGLGGSPGQFSGFDLDAVLLSDTDCADAACAAALAGTPVFDFPGALFLPGTQRLPVDPKLFGTGPAGNTVDDTVATLAAFDGNSTTAIPGADGFVSMGDGGLLIFNLTAAVPTAGLFLYIGEVGDNGEVAAGSITVSDRPQGIPEPAPIALLGLGLAALVAAARRRRL